MVNNPKIPFGLLFEEEAPSPENTILPIYDDERDISVIHNGDHLFAPFVEANKMTATETVTHVVRESTDEDPSYISNAASTYTVTATKREDTDTDDGQLSKWGQNSKALLMTDQNEGIETATKVAKETTDYM